MPLPGQRLYANSIWIGPASLDNYMPGRAGYKIFGSVQHHSASTLQGLIDRFKNPPAVSGGGASAHFAIDREEETRDGLLGFGQYAIRYQLVDTADMAFADSDYWENLTTVAVEHVRLWGSGPGTPGYEPITDGQYRSSTELQLILGADNGYPLDLTRITPHNAYSPTTCPGDLSLPRIIHPQGVDDDVTPQQDSTLIAAYEAARFGRMTLPDGSQVPTPLWAAINGRFDEIAAAVKAIANANGVPVDLKPTMDLLTAVKAEEDAIQVKVDALSKHEGVGTA